MKTLLIASLSFVLVNVHGQQSGGTWHVDDYGLSYELPNDWRSDPFSSSSVCDCPGTINDNGTWDEEKYLGMVIYPHTKGQTNDYFRAQVWGNRFVAITTPEKVKIGKISYERTFGHFEGKENEPTWRYISVDIPKKNRPYLTIYFFGQESPMTAFGSKREAIMASFKRKKINLDNL